MLCRSEIMRGQAWYTHSKLPEEWNSLPANMVYSNHYDIE